MASPLYTRYTDKLTDITTRIGVPPGYIAKATGWTAVLQITVSMDPQISRSIPPVVPNTPPRNAYLSLLKNGILNLLAEILQDPALVLSISELQASGLGGSDGWIQQWANRIQGPEHTSTRMLWRLAHYSLKNFVATFVMEFNKLNLSSYYPQLKEAINAAVDNIFLQPMIFQKVDEWVQLTMEIRRHILETFRPYANYAFDQLFTSLLKTNTIRKVLKLTMAIWDSTDLALSTNSSNARASATALDIFLTCGMIVSEDFLALLRARTRGVLEPWSTSFDLEEHTSLSFERIADLFWAIPHPSTDSVESRTVFGALSSNVMIKTAKDSDRIGQDGAHTMAHVERTAPRLARTGKCIPWVGFMAETYARDPASVDSEAALASLNWWENCIGSKAIDDQKAFEVSMTMIDDGILDFLQILANGKMAVNEGSEERIAQGASHLAHLLWNNVSLVDSKKHLRAFESIKRKGGKRNLTAIVLGDIAARKKSQKADDQTKIGFYCWALGCEKRHGWSGCTLMHCSKCKTGLYCSAECQKNDWKRHKPNCNKWFNIDQAAGR